MFMLRNYNKFPLRLTSSAVAKTVLDMITEPTAAVLLELENFCVDALTRRLVAEYRAEFIRSQRVPSTAPSYLLPRHGKTARKRASACYRANKVA